eukprot:scaffold43930_cov34-Prasinocladus_malaysianus.AAC.1
MHDRSAITGKQDQILSSALAALRARLLPAERRHRHIKSSTSSGEQNQMRSKKIGLQTWHVRVAKHRVCQNHKMT